HSRNCRLSTLSCPHWLFLAAGTTSGLLGTVAFQGYENVLYALSGGTYGRLGFSTDEMLLGMALGPLASPRQAVNELRGIKDVANTGRAVGSTSTGGALGSADGEATQTPYFAGSATNGADSVAELSAAAKPTTFRGERSSVTPE